MEPHGVALKLIRASLPAFTGIGGKTQNSRVLDLNCIRDKISKFGFLESC